MKLSSTLILGCIVLWSNCAVGAETWTGSREVQVCLGITNFIDDSGVGTSAIASGGVLGMSLQTDWLTNNSLFDCADLSAPVVTYTRSLEVTTGPGQTKLIQLEISSDPLNHITAHGFGQIPMTPGTQGKYNLDSENLRSGVYGEFGNMTLSGVWSISGPTEMKSGTFSLPAYIQPEYCFPAYDYIDTADYPASILLYSSRDQLLWETKLDPYYFMIEESVDGISVKFKVNGLYFIGMTTTVMPEPSTLTMLLVAGLLVIRKRRVAGVPGSSVDRRIIS